MSSVETEFATLKIFCHARVYNADLADILHPPLTRSPPPFRHRASIKTQWASYTCVMHASTHALYCSWSYDVVSSAFQEFL